ncbi:unnamed protein product [Lymnaea stagnalis]|uniref:Uncharacterized protein n=1 Tax=Lymnaea stagnalis TaxID=6523 RepID=A0AAV2I2J1_LYMST
MGHQCPATCSEKCPPCEVAVWKTLKCGHSMIGRCGYVQICPQRCSNTCACGYTCIKKCGEPCSSCSSQLTCGHRCLGTPSSTRSATKLCHQSCRYVCKNGHSCPQECCFPCPSKCSKTLRCGHQCKQPFESADTYSTRGTSLLYGLSLKNFNICDEPCRNICDRGHECLSNCSEPCLPCRENLECGHKCNSVPGWRRNLYSYKSCQEKCRKTCRRGHSCPKLCREACPDSCPKLSCLMTSLFAFDVGFMSPEERLAH